MNCACAVGWSVDISYMSVVHKVSLCVMVDELCVVLCMFVGCGYGY